MLSARWIVGPHLLGLLLLAVMSLHPAEAYSAPGDPPSGSPAGSAYVIPLQHGRADAAPKSGGASAGGGNASVGETGSEYRTENNFGSASQVPGAPGTAGSGGPGSGGTGGSASGSSAGGGTGVGGAAPGAQAPAGSALTSQAATGTGNTSVGVNVVLLAAIAAVAIAIGLASRRFTTRQRH